MIAFCYKSKQSTFGLNYYCAKCAENAALFGELFLGEIQISATDKCSKCGCNISSKASTISTVPPPKKRKLVDKIKDFIKK